MFHLVYLSIFVAGALGQVVKDGVCNYAEIGGFVTDLNITEMFGTWNELARIDNEAEVGECSSLKIVGSNDANGNLVEVQATFAEVFNKTTSSYNGTINAVNGLYNLNLTGYLDLNFVVQATNYKEYAILYSCNTLTVEDATQNLNNTKVVFAWQFHKKAEISSAEQATIQNIVDQNPDLNGTEWKTVSHSKTACGNAAVTLAAPHVLIFLAALFISKRFA